MIVFPVSPVLLLLLFMAVRRSTAFRTSPLLKPSRQLPGAIAASCGGALNHAKNNKHVSFMSATSTSDNNDDDNKLEKKTKGRKQRVLIGYRVTALSYFTASLLALQKSSLTPFACYTAAGPTLAAGMAYILSNAAQKSDSKDLPRLASATYKRLNIVLAKYGAIGLLLAVLVPQPRNPFWYFWTMLSFITMVNSIKGYGYGVKGWKLEGETVPLVKEDIIQLTKGAAKTILSVPRNLQSTAYLASTVMVGTLNFLKLAEIVSLLVASGIRDPYVVASRLSRYGKLLLLTGASLTLTDGANRGRLEGATFIQLNFLSAFAFGAMAAHLKDLAHSVTPLVRVVRFFAVMHVLFGCMGIMFKKKKEDYHDELLKGPNTERLSDDFPSED